MFVKQRLRPIPIIDVFAGAGGLGEGFAAWPNREEPLFHTALSVEKNPAALRTLRLRAFYRMFHPQEVPEEYYRFLRGEAVTDEFLDFLDGKAPLSLLGQSIRGQDEVWSCALGEKGFREDELNCRIRAARNDRDDWVLIGGPPCQPFSTAGRSRQRAIPGYSAETDPRNLLYLEYLRIISRHWPPVFVMENVKGIITAKLGGQPALEKMLEDLQDPGRVTGVGFSNGKKRHRYQIWPLASRCHRSDLFGLFKPHEYIIEADHYGIPQKRHRVILLGIRDDLRINPGLLVPQNALPPSVGEILYGLPPLRSGIARTPQSRSQWREIVSGAVPPGGWRGAETDDVHDSPAQCHALLRAAVKRRWFDELNACGQTDVREQIEAVLSGLIQPAMDRGGEYLAHGAPPAKLADWYEDPCLHGVCQHATREHMPEDHYRYLYAAAFAEARGVSPRLRDFPPSLLPNHGNVSRSLKSDNFADRFRVQVGTLPASTVMSHLAKDGHYFIHPDPSQARSLTVREAARLQTFPDNYFFCGNRSEQYTQVGNAVPPLLGSQIAEIVAGVFEAGSANRTERLSACA
ncbi:MAG: DNA cytosine methyltransferase [Chromatiaceae bacterium]|nr:DNA cytosine methyltransferase [Chromatiaceae bacterium]